MKKNSTLRYHHKSEILGHYILELIIWEIDDSARYPENIKYSLFFMDRRNQNKIIFDNHFPKEHHYHINDQEFIYDFSDEVKLIKDFKKLVYNIFGVMI